MSLQVLSHAKINLALQILGKKPDGYHNLRTIFHKITLADNITLSSIPDNRIEISSTDASLPVDEGNLAYQAAMLLKRTFHIRKGVKIAIQKNIPVSAGLGGGSSNAAAVLHGLNKLWSLNITTNKLISLGKPLGSDVPFFVSNNDACFGIDKGENIFPLTVEAGNHFIILANSGLALSTQDIYQQFSITQSSEFFSGDKRDKAGNFLFYLEEMYMQQGYSCPIIALEEIPLFNDLESVSLREHPELKTIKQNMKAIGTKRVLMSGSGPTIFGIFNSKQEAEEGYMTLKKETDLSLHMTQFYESKHDLAGRPRGKNIS